MKSLFKNCLTVEENDGWLMPLRFTEAQMKRYALTDVYEIRSYCASSVILSFKSAAKKIKFEYRITKKARDFAAFDVVCGGVLRESINLTEDTGTLEISLPADAGIETHIYLPQLVCIELRGITADEPLIPTEKKDRSWLAIGDSITQGMVAKKPSSTYPSLISEEYGYNLINAGVGGIVFNKDELDYIGFEPDVITVALGCNDWGTDGAQFESAVSDYVERLLSLYKCRNIHFILPIWRSDADEVKADMTFKQHVDIIRRVVSRYPFINTVDGYALVPHLKEFFGDPGDVKVHPTDEGFLRYALALTKFIHFK